MCKRSCGRFAVGIIAVSIFLHMTGCAPAPQPPPKIQNTMVFPNSYDQVWGAIIAVIMEKNLPIRAVEKSSGLVTTDFSSFVRGWGTARKMREFSVMPTIFLSIWRSGAMRVSVFAQAVNEKSTRVKIIVDLQAFEKSDGRHSGSWRQCRSKGVIEKRYFDDIKKNL
jgi:hypothetical protein